MILTRLAKLFTFTVLLSGCAYLHSLDENLPHQIDSWMANQEYGKALDTLYYIQPDNPNYKVLMKQKEEIIKLAVRFEENILQEGKKYLKEKDWHHADETYKHGLDKLPDSRAIRKARAEFLRKRNAYLQKLKIKLLQNKTQWLLNNTPVREEIVRVIPKDTAARWDLDEHNQAVDSTTNTLITCVNESIARNQLDVGRQCLTIATQLSPSPRVQQKRHEAEKRLEQEIASRSRNLSKQGKKTLRKAKRALATGDFKSARRMIDKLPEQDRKNASVLKFRDDLNEQTEDYVDLTIQEGRKLYSAGKVQEAYLLWKSLKSLSPDNERLQKLIDRAEKVLRKLHKIGNNQDTIVPPAKNRD